MQKGDLKSRLKKSLRLQLLKINWFKCLVDSSLARQRNHSYHSDWELIMRGQSVRDLMTEKSEHKTDVLVTDDNLIVDYMNGRCVNQQYVSPLYIDSTNWGR